MAGGSAVMLRRLLEHFSPDAYAVLTDRVSAFDGLPRDGWLPVPHHFRGSQRPLFPSEITATIARSDAHINQGFARGLLAGAVNRLSALNVTGDVPEVVQSVIVAIEAEKPDIVLAISSDPIFMVAAANAARITNRQLYVHLFDLFARNRYSLPKRMLAARNERNILRAAERVFVPNEAMASHYRARLGISPIVIPNGTVIPARPAQRSVSTLPTILYTGAVYWAQYDSLRNLVTALRDLPDVKFDVRTDASPYHLMRAGLRQEHVSPGFATQEASLEAQRNADLLFLPLGFRTSAPAVIRTALPAKVAEYLVSGTPILVHAPADAYISQYARKAKWGYVVDKPDPNDLVGAVRKLLNDSQLRSDLISAAYQEAVRAHDLHKIVREYGRYFS